MIVIGIVIIIIIIVIFAISYEMSSTRPLSVPWVSIPEGMGGGDISPQYFRWGDDLYYHPPILHS